MVDDVSARQKQRRRLVGSNTHRVTFRRGHPWNPALLHSALLAAFGKPDELSRGSAWASWTHDGSYRLLTGRRAEGVIRIDLYIHQRGKALVHVTPPDPEVVMLLYAWRDAR